MIKEYYKDMLITTFGYDNKFIIANKNYINVRPKSVRSAKILITKYVNSLPQGKKSKLKYLRTDR